MSRRTRTAVLVPGLLAALALLPNLASAAQGPAFPGVHALQTHQHATRTNGGTVSPLDDGGDGPHDGEGDSLEIADQADEFAAERSAPAESVSAAALLAARTRAAALPRAAGRTTQITNQPMFAEPKGYTDPFWSNEGAGFRNVSGRVTALATDGGTWYVGTADGGVWKTTDGGTVWHPIWDDQSTLSIGALMVDSHHALWVGTGEANTNADSYLGTGVYRSTDHGASFSRVGGDQLNDRQTFRLRDDGYGHVYAATSKGLYRHRSTTSGGRWTLVLKPDPNPTGSPYLTSQISDVVVRPGTHGRTVLAVLGWRNGSDYNGFYLSSTGGGAGSFRAIKPSGAIDDSDIGRTTLAYSADGSRLYTLIESPKRLLAGDATNLQGVFVSRNGNPAGPYQKIAGSQKLGKSGSAIADFPGYHVGIQSWYNQALAVDPKNPEHVFVSLEEVFQTTNGGRTFTTASPYWNYGLKCDGPCPPATHPDQHALALTSNGRVLIGNDGGVYSRSESITGYGHWDDLNATLHTLQYYDAAAATERSGQVYWGGLQDNGTTVLFPWRSKQNIEPAGGDGGTVLVDPSDGNRAVGEYTDLAMYSTQDGGHTFTTISPVCGYNPNEDTCDPSARFIAPFQADIHDTNHWVAAGNKVWDTRKGWDTRCDDNGCDWKPEHSFGTDAVGGYNIGSALAVSGVTTYAAWTDSSGNPSPSFQSGIDTNYGGRWHRISSPVLPNRYISGLTIDPKNPAHVYAIFNGYSRRWIPGGGLGTVFESTDGGSTWRNISGNLPDAPGDGLAVVHGTLVLGTDVGLFSASADRPTHWSRFGSLPNSVVDNVRPIPGTSSVVVATHGRGIWRVDVG